MTANQGHKDSAEIMIEQGGRCTYPENIQCESCVVGRGGATCEATHPDNPCPDRVDLAKKYLARLK